MSSAFQKKMNRRGQQHIVNLAHAARDLWKKACEVEGVPDDSKFVVFSPTNQYADFYNLAMGQLHAARAEYAAGGYVGLSTRRTA